MEFIIIGLALGFGLLSMAGLFIDTFKELDDEG